MRKNNFLVPFSILDGGVRVLLLFILCEFSVSELLVNWGLDIYRTPLVCSGIFALLSSTLSCLLMFHLPSRKHILLFWLSSFGCFLLGCGLFLSNLMTIRFRLFSMRPIGLGDGLMLLFIIVGFFALSEIICILCLVILLLRHRIFHSR